MQKSESNACTASTYDKSPKKPGNQLPIRDMTASKFFIIRFIPSYQPIIKKIQYVNIPQEKKQD
jgi:hypothetical protein